MALCTEISLRNQVIYSIYVRNHTMEGTFKAIEKDLDRIKALGTDVIWFLPIHPIGVEGKKGSLGCPYAIKDYRKVNPEYGTLEDFQHLVEAIHKRDMKCIIDVVYNHTAIDSVLAKEHKEYFYKKEDGSLGNKAGDWADVIDLDYQNKALWDYQIETLKMWAKLVDGVRCDVASLVPLAFWLEARSEVEKIHPGFIWLAESVHPGFVKYVRHLGFNACSDSEVYQAFDITYDYDIWDEFEAYIEGKATLTSYITALKKQEVIYPSNYVKLRCLENHDQARIKQRIQDEKALKNLTAFMYFQKGTALIYGGQEVEAEHTPSLFEKEPINWETGHDLTHLLQALYNIKKQDIVAKGNYELEAYDEAHIVVGSYQTKEQILVGLFTLKGKEACVKVPLQDGSYINLISKEKVEVTGGLLKTFGEPIIISHTINE